MIETCFVPIAEAAKELKTTEDRLLMAAIDLRITLTAFAKEVLVRELSPPPKTSTEGRGEIWHDDPQDPQTYGIKLLENVTVALERSNLISLWTDGKAFVSGMAYGEWSIYSGGRYVTISPCKYISVAQQMYPGRKLVPPIVARSQLLVIQEDLDKLKHGVTPPPGSVKANITETERGKMLAILLGMAMDAYGYDPEKKRNPATGENHGSIHAAISRFGLKVDSDTIRRHISEAEKLYPFAKPNKT